MQQNKLILLGKIIKVHGFHGAVMIALEGDFSEKVKEMESVFVEVDGKPVPFLFEWVKESGPNSIIVKFEYYDSDKLVSEFIGCRILSDIEIVIQSSDSKLPLHFTGFVLYNSDNHEIGEIIKIVSFPMQIMFELRTTQGTEILIPYNEEWILETDHSNKTIRVDLPEGLDTINI